MLLPAFSLLTQTDYLLALGLTGAETQAEYQLDYGMTFVLLQKEVCGRCLKPTEELQAMVILRSLLASSQPGFDSLLKAVTAPMLCVQLDAHHLKKERSDRQTHQRQSLDLTRRGKTGHRFSY